MATIKQKAQKMLLDYNCDDLVINVNQYKENTPENAKNWIYVSDIMIEFLERVSQNESNEDGVLPIQHVIGQLSTFLKWYHENDECTDVLTYESVAEKYLADN